MVPSCPHITVRTYITGKDPLPNKASHLQYHCQFTPHATTKSTDGQNNDRVQWTNHQPQQELAYKVTIQQSLWYIASNVHAEACQTDQHSHTTHSRDSSGHALRHSVSRPGMKTQVQAIRTAADPGSLLISLLILHMCVARVERDISKWCRAVQVRNKTSWAHCDKRVPSGPTKLGVNSLLSRHARGMHGTEPSASVIQPLATCMQPCSPPKTGHQSVRGTQHAASAHVKAARARLHNAMAFLALSRSLLSGAFGSACCKTASGRATLHNSCPTHHLLQLGPRPPTCTGCPRAQQQQQ